MRADKTLPAKCHPTQPVPLLIRRLIGRKTVNLESGWPSAFYYIWALQQTIHIKTRLLLDRTGYLVIPLRMFMDY